MLGGFGVVVEEVALMRDTAVVVVVIGNGARDKGGEEGNVFVGNVSVAVGTTESVFWNCAACIPIILPSR